MFRWFKQTQEKSQAQMEKQRKVWANDSKSSARVGRLNSARLKLLLILMVSSLRLDLTWILFLERLRDSGRNMLDAFNDDPAIVQAKKATSTSKLVVDYPTHNPRG